MKERVVNFGPEQTLLGIETVAAESVASPTRPTWIFLNAGVVHRVGPHRLTVNLARRVALAGYATLRFDLSGLGDSRPRNGVTFEHTAVQDICDAMDFLQRTSGVPRFVLCGLCSGADNAVRTALLDRRVAAIALLDPYAFRTIRSNINRSLQRVRNSKTLDHLASRTAYALMRTLRQRRLPDAHDAQPGPDFRSLSRERPSRGAFAAQLNFIADQGTQVLLVYSGGDTDNYNYAGQFEDAFRWYGLVGRVRTAYLENCNHTFAELEHQRILGDLLIAWGEELFPSAVVKPPHQVGPTG
jgi:pimeloyl-ACP methyl ester carboxylesterase